MLNLMNKKLAMKAYLDYRNGSREFKVLADYFICEIPLRNLANRDSLVLTLVGTDNASFISYTLMDNTRTTLQGESIESGRVVLRDIPKSICYIMVCGKLDDLDKLMVLSEECLDSEITYIPNQSGSSGNASTIVEEYDDTELRQAIQTLNARLDLIKDKQDRERLAKLDWVAEKYL